MALRQTLGVVIRLADLGEADKIVTLYTPATGQISGIAKGAKRSLKRFVNKLEIFSLLDLEYSDHYRLPIINQAELLNSHLPLREDYHAYTAAALVCELYRLWTHQGDHDQGLFALLNWVLARLQHREGRLESLVLFLARFYRRLGYQPDLSGCVSCRRLDRQAGPFRFQARQGTIVCSHCRPRSSAQGLSIATVRLLGRALELPLDKLSRLRLAPASTREALALFKEHDRVLLDRELAAWNFLGE